MTCDRCGQPTEPRMRFCAQCGAPLADQLIGAVFGERFRIVAFLGSGGMGRVYRAEHITIGKPVAIKVLAPEIARDAGMLERFRREAMVAGRLAHPNVAAVIDFGVADDLPYAVMELVDGTPLDQLLRDHGPLELDRAIELARQIAEGVGAAHRAGVVHRDIKPGNVIITHPGDREQAKLVDFGLAALRLGGEGRITVPGAGMGTPAYVAPEQLSGEAVDARADVYALGALLCEMLTGAPPFDADDVMELITAHLRRTPRPPSERRPELPEALDRLILRMLSKSPAARPATGREVGEQLARIAAELQHAAPPIIERERALLVVRLSADELPAAEQHAAHERIAAHVAGSGGTLARSVGDDLIAHFASAESAVRTADQVARAIAPRPPQAVHLGLVELGAGGGVFGEPVNVALRLARLCAPGETLLSDPARADLGLAMRAALVASGTLRLDRRSAPIAVHRVDGLLRAPAAARSPAVPGRRRPDHAVEFTCRCGCLGVIIDGRDRPPSSRYRTRCARCSAQLSIRVEASAGPARAAPGSTTDHGTPLPVVAPRPTSTPRADVIARPSTHPELDLDALVLHQLAEID